MRQKANNNIRFIDHNIIMYRPICCYVTVGGVYSQNKLVQIDDGYQHEEITNWGKLSILVRQFASSMPRLLWFLETLKIPD